MILLGLDLETGGSFDKPLEKNFVTEIGMVLWDTEQKAPVKIYNEIILWPGTLVADEAAEYNGVTQQMTQDWGVPPDRARSALCEFLKRADYVVAHNGRAFDLPIVMQTWSDCGADQKIWIDTMEDVPYPKDCRSRNLTYLTAFHKLLNPFPHRAVTDVLIMLEILAQYDINEVIKRAEAPRWRIEAVCLPFARKDEAKTMGFRWDAPNKIWYKNYNDYELENAGFTACGKKKNYVDKNGNLFFPFKIKRLGV